MVKRHQNDATTKIILFQKFYKHKIFHCKLCRIGDPMKAQPRLAIATKGTNPTYVDVFLERHRRLIELTATIILAAIKNKQLRITKQEVMDQIRASTSMRALLRQVKDYRLSEWLSVANAMGAFYDYGLEIKSGIGFTFIVARNRVPKNKNVYDFAMAKVQRERAAINTVILAKEQRDYSRELERLRRYAGL
jgi:hypothetical protein